MTATFHALVCMHKSAAHTPALFFGCHTPCRASTSHILQLDTGYGTCKSAGDQYVISSKAITAGVAIWYVNGVKTHFSGCKRGLSKTGKRWVWIFRHGQRCLVEPEAAHHIRNHGSHSGYLKTYQTLQPMHCTAPCQHSTFAYLSSCVSSCTYTPDL